MISDKFWSRVFNFYTPRLTCHYYLFILCISLNAVTYTGKLIPAFTLKNIRNYLLTLYFKILKTSIVKHIILLYLSIKINIFISDDYYI